MDEYTKKIIYYLNNQKYNFKENFKEDLKLYEKSNICGDEIEYFLKLDENQNIIDICYKASSCSLNIASAEILCECLIGKNIEKIKNLNFEKIIEENIKFPKQKIHCVNLSFEHFRKL